MGSEMCIRDRAIYEARKIAKKRIEGTGLPRPHYKTQLPFTVVAYPPWVFGVSSVFMIGYKTVVAAVIGIIYEI